MKIGYNELATEYIWETFCKKLYVSQIMVREDFITATEKAFETINVIIEDGLIDDAWNAFSVENGNLMYKEGFKKAMRYISGVANNSPDNYPGIKITYKNQGTIITAADARLRTKFFYSKELKTIMGEIKVAADNGKRELNVNRALEQDTIEIIKKNGFEIILMVNLNHKITLVGSKK